MRIIPHLDDYYVELTRIKYLCIGLSKPISISTPFTVANRLMQYLFFIFSKITFFAYAPLGRAIPKKILGKSTPSSNTHPHIYIDTPTDTLR
jgi:hypothetical protein